MNNINDKFDHNLDTCIRRSVFSNSFEKTIASNIRSGFTSDIWNSLESSLTFSIRNTIENIGRAINERHV